MRITVPAPAKVNLFLEVTGRRSDGYHLLATLFARLDLADTLTAEPARRLTLSIDDRRRTGPRLGAGPENLVLRAAEALRRELKLKAGARLRLVKRIPVGAGLGGGSSDAAAALKALSRLWGVPDRPGLLKRLGRTLGADVPFFLQDHPLCAARGIGDRLRPVPRPTKAFPPLVLAYPGVPFSTAEAYRAAAVPRRKAALTSLSQLNKLERLISRGAPVERWSIFLFNRLQDAVEKRCPEAGEARRRLEALGARGVLMSGSGSVVFGFADPGAARRLRRARPGWEILTARIAAS